MLELDLRYEMYPQESEELESDGETERIAERQRQLEAAEQAAREVAVRAAEEARWIAAEEKAAEEAKAALIGDAAAAARVRRLPRRAGQVRARLGGRLPRGGRALAERGVHARGPQERRPARQGTRGGQGRPHGVRAKTQSVLFPGRRREAR